MHDLDVLVRDRYKFQVYGTINWLIVIGINTDKGTEYRNADESWRSRTDESIHRDY